MRANRGNDFVVQVGDELGGLFLEAGGDVRYGEIDACGSFLYFSVEIGHGRRHPDGARLRFARLIAMSKAFRRVPISLVICILYYLWPGTGGQFGRIAGGTGMDAEIQGSRDTISPCV